MSVSIDENALDLASDIIYIKNILGETVFSTYIDMKYNQFEMNLSDLNSGIYYLVLEFKDRIITERFIIEK